MTEIKPVPSNTLRACLIPGAPEDSRSLLRPCRPGRDWMDKVPQKYIYRCIPLVAANTMGWELLSPVTSTIEWSGGAANADLSIHHEEQSPFAATSHFGSGIVTWYLPFLFRTPSEMGLVVTGPANHEHDDAVPLDAFVRTDWLPFPFTMNWRLTRQNTDVTFQKGEPICRVFPFPLAMLDEVSVEIVRLEDDLGFLAEVNKFGQARQQNVAAQQQQARQWQATGEAPTGKGVWNAQYVRARTKDVKDGYSQHQTVFRCKDVETK